MRPGPGAHMCAPAGRHMCRPDPYWGLLGDQLRGRVAVRALELWTIHSGPARPKTLHQTPIKTAWF